MVSNGNHKCSRISEGNEVFYWALSLHISGFFIFNFHIVFFSFGMVSSILWAAS